MAAFHKIAALFRVGLLSAASYRIQMALSLGGLIATVIPLYFVANALQPLMGDVIRTEGGHYFGFVLIGMIAFSFLSSAVTAVPGVVGSGIATGTLEALVSTRTRLPTVFAGMMSYSMAWLTVRAAILLVAGAFLGAQILWSQLFVAAGILALIILSYLPFGILSAALILAFRTSGPLAQGVLTLSVLLGGVYYPTHVIPSWIEQISAVVPLTYGLRALRQTVLEGMPFTEVLPDLSILAAMTVVLFALSVAAFQTGMRYAKRAGSLAQY